MGSFISSLRARPRVPQTVSRNPKMRRTRTRKGASPIIAALLLIGIAVAGAVVTYTWVMTMVQQQGTAAQTAIRIDEVMFANDNTTDSLWATKVTIRNTGSVAAIIDTVILYRGEAQIFKQDGIGFAVQSKTLGTFGICEDLLAPVDAVIDFVWTGTIPDMGQVPNADNQYDATYNADLVTSTGYVIKVVTDNGFAVSGTYYTSSSFG